eukprot:1633286-Pleurochrysis_carterae.AAC.11
MSFPTVVCPTVSALQTARATCRAQHEAPDPDDEQLYVDTLNFGDSVPAIWTASEKHAVAARAQFDDVKRGAAAGSGVDAQEAWHGGS